MDLQEVAYRMSDLRIERNELYGELEIIETIQGRNLQEIMAEHEVEFSPAMVCEFSAFLPDHATYCTLVAVVAHCEIDVVL